MTREEAANIIKSECYAFNLFNLDRTTMINTALDMAVEALEEKCHNENPDYADCDQFVCSNCGIELQDWHAVERSEDGDITFHEYEFKYCPNCGARIGGEVKDLLLKVQDTWENIREMGGTDAKKGTYDDGWDQAIKSVDELFMENFGDAINAEPYEEDSKNEK